MSKPPERDELEIYVVGLHLDGGVGGVVHHSRGQSVEAEDRMSNERGLTGISK